MKSQIPSLDGLRAISILFVILGHIWLLDMGKPAIPYPANLLIDATLGVNVFFVISGFLITTLLMEEEAGTGGISLKGFYTRRAFRIFPAYYFVLIVYLMLQLSSVLYFSTRSWMSSIFYYKYIDGGDWESGHFWSLSVEEHFYLIWPLVFKFWKKGRVYFAYAVIVLVMFFRYNAYMRLFPSALLDSTISIFQRGDALMVGCLFALHRKRLETMTAGLAGRRLAPFVILLLLALIGKNYISDWSQQYHLHLGLLLIPLGLSWNAGLISNLLIAILMLISINGRGPWFRFLNLPAVKLTGKLSYSLYLWQQLFFSPRLGVASRFPQMLLFIVIAALISYYCIEKPFLRLRDQFMNRKLGRLIAK